MTRSIFVGAIALLIAGITGCEKMNSKDRAAFTPHSQGIQRATQAVLHEGLPDGSKPDALDSNGNAPLKIHNSRFTAQSLTIKAEHLEALRGILSSKDSFQSSEPKKCVFHADFAVLWKDGTETCQVLLCFTCSDALFIRGDQFFGIEIRPQAQTQLAGILQPYRTPSYGPLRVVK